MYTVLSVVFSIAVILASVGLLIAALISQRRSAGDRNKRG